MSTSARTAVEWVSRHRRSVLAAGMLLLLLGGFVLWKNTSGSPYQPADAGRSPRAQLGDPRVDYDGPFLNVHPSVAYVGDARCAECHEDKAQTYHQHPMGRSLLPITAVAPRQRYDAPHHNPFKALGRRFEVERRGDRVWHWQGPGDGGRNTALQQKWEVHYVIGSGARGHSYLTNHDGYLFQTPISWYSQKQIWDVSPGYGDAFLPERPVAGMCLFCHANRAQFEEGTENHYQTPIFDGHAIGCERCHGPGERHVLSHTERGSAAGQRDPLTGADYTIVNPRRLEPALREAVCEQCHLAGEIRLLRRGGRLYDFRPGLPLEKFWTIFVQARKPGEEDKAVNHVEQLYLSRCFQGSAGQMGCISCHDPHEAVGPERRVSYYRDRCLSCHQQDSCSLPPAARRRSQVDDSCIACHMPRYATSDIAHAAATDHHIPRQPHTGARGDEPEALATVANSSLTLPARRPSPFALVPFYRAHLELHDPEQARDLGIALIQATFRGKLDLLSYSVSPLALLEQAVRLDADDLDAWEAKGGALLLQRRFREALAAFETVLARSGRRERSLVQAAHLAQQLQQGEKVLRYWQQAVAVNPWMPSYRKNLALVLADQQDWQGCGRQCEAWLRLDPMSNEARDLGLKCRRSGSPTNPQR